MSTTSSASTGKRSGEGLTPFLCPRKSAFECASMLLIFKQRKYLNDSQADVLVSELASVCKMIVSFSRTLK